MINPFRYGGIVTGDSFCNRVEEQRDLLRAMEDCAKIFLYSERRMGKTSLVQQVLTRLPQDRFLPVYIDLWPTDSLSSCVTLIAKSVSESLSDPVGKVMQFTKRFFSHLRPSVSLDDDGKPVVSFGLTRSNVGDPDIDSVLTVPDKIATERGKTPVIVFDEFQRILEYESDLFERKIRSTIQSHDGVCYLFLGSRKHLIRSMFLDESRPLYRSAGHYPLGPIAEESWLPYVTKQFRESGKSITEKSIHLMFELTEGHPFYMQHIAHILWERCELNETVEEDEIESALTLLLEREGYAFSTLWESLTVAQRRVLSGIANKGSEAHVFSSDFLDEQSLSSPSTVQRAVQSLLVKDIIDRENGGFIITDRFFRMWIVRMSE